MHSERIFCSSATYCTSKKHCFGLTKLAAAACMQCTAQRQQKAANTSLLESRSLLQTVTLVFPRPIVCSRLSNNINMLAKKIQAANGGGAWPPGPPAGSATGSGFVAWWSYRNRKCVTPQVAQNASNVQISTLYFSAMPRIPVQAGSTAPFLSLIPNRIFFWNPPIPLWFC